MSVITRFAPSPTGYLHIGGARTALFNYLFAKNNGGKFLLRIEDTDKERSTTAAIEAILQGLNWLGLNADEKPILQSQNIARHKQIALKLLQENKAYYCYTPSEELQEMRKSAEKKGEVFRFQSPWRDQAMSQSSSVKPVIRIKAPLVGETVIKDLVQGEVKVQNSELDDLVMLRGDETPTYMLAVVVDDHDMGITHTIRGDDHLNNAFRQKVIFDAMNWDVPKFAHIPLIHGSDGAKMSKRHGATSVIDYKELGYLPEAMRNYLLRLGWSHGDSEIISDAEAISWFSLDKVGRSPSRFDFTKLDNVNTHYLRQKTAAELLNLLVVEEKGAEFKTCSEAEKSQILEVIEVFKPTISNLDALAAAARIYFSENNEEISKITPEEKQLLAEKKSLTLDLQKFLSDLEDYSRDGVKNALSKFAEENSLKIKHFGPLLRVILTFSSSSKGGIFDVVKLLGKEKTLARIESALSL